MEALHARLGDARQVAVIRELCLNDKRVKDVAAQLGMTPLRVQVTKSRAIKKLRGCLQRLRLYEEWSL